jgi:hypothetical protein
MIIVHYLLVILQGQLSVFYPRTFARHPLSINYVDSMTRGDPGSTPGTGMTMRHHLLIDR